MLANNVPKKPRSSMIATAKINAKAPYALQVNLRSLLFLVRFFLLFFSLLLVFLLCAKFTSSTFGDLRKLLVIV